MGGTQARDCTSQCEKMIQKHQIYIGENLFNNSNLFLVYQTLGVEDQVEY